MIEYSGGFRRNTQKHCGVDWPPDARGEAKIRPEFRDALNFFEACA
jgi:hypothetical protein